MTKKKQSWLVAAIVLIALVLDQVSKVYVKTHFDYGEAHEVFSWFWITFIENPGMAFGWEFGSKLFLTIFRIVVSGAVMWYLIRLIKDEYKLGYQIVITLILSGAVGNIIDCVCYGVIFSESTYFTTAECMPAVGYAPWFMGKAVDMF